MYECVQRGLNIVTTFLRVRPLKCEPEHPGHHTDMLPDQDFRPGARVYLRYMYVTAVPVSPFTDPCRG